MDARPSPVGVTAIERVLGWQRIAHGGIELSQLIQRREVRSRVLEIPHTDQMQQHAFQRSVARALSLAEAGAVYSSTAFPHRGQAIRHDQPRIVVGMELQIFRRQSHRSQLAENERNAAW